MAIRPSETTHGLEWLANFPIDRRRAATLLIDSLRVISSSRFRVTMSDALDNAVRQLTQPVGIYPVRELPRDGIDPFFPPLDLPFTATSGSEALVGNIIRDVVGRRPRFDRASSYVSLTKLRQHKVRTLLLVDDYSGTGDQVVRYVDAWTRHPTIKSWHSYGWVRIHVLLLAASVQAQRRLEEHPFVAGVDYIERGLGFDTAPWTEEEQEDVAALCRRYAHKPEFALGYGETRGLLALHHTVPNNLPHILWQTKCPRVRDWAPLFGDRRMPSLLQVELDDYRLEADPKRIAAAIRQERLGEALDAQTNPTVRNLLLVLGAVESGYRDPRSLADLLGLSRVATQRIVEACQMLGLLDSARRLTKEGRGELGRARNRPSLPHPVAPAGDDAPYYPLALRGAM